MSEALDPTLRNLNDCGCCQGVTAETPATITNRPGLSAIAYRVGVHAQFKASMLARLSDPNLPALQNLTTRDDDDFSIALIDGWASVADVLTFYQERIANESYLRTATERLSILQLAQLIGYQLRPGVAAGTYLAFTLETAAGAPQQVALAKGLKVQSIPGPGQQPQTFETVEQIDARVEWNALQPQVTELVVPGQGDTQVFLKGTATNLKPGDGILFVGAEKEGDPNSERWDFRTVQSVTPYQSAGYTLVTWAEGLGSASTTPSASPLVYAMRQRAALFGHNAPDWRTMPDNVCAAYDSSLTATEWPRFNIFYGQWHSLPTIFLDAIYQKIVVGSWLVLAVPAWTELYKVQGIADASMADFALTAKTSRVTLTGRSVLSRFDLRSTTVYGQSELLDMAEQPLRTPVEGAPSASLNLDQNTLTPLEGATVVLDGVVVGLGVGQRLIVSGKLLRAKISGGVNPADIVPDDGSEAFSIQPGDTPLIVQSPVMTPEGGVVLHLQDKNGFTAWVTLSVGSVLLEPANQDDAAVSEAAAVKAVGDDGVRTTITLQMALQNSYDRATVTIYGNVAAATNGDSKQEVLGSGDGTQPYQRFTLKNSPLTYVSAATPSGTESTLQVYVNNIQWHETPTLYGHGPRERIFITRRDDAGNTTVEFGDGVSGARLPSGSENVTATYRQGIGSGGNLNAGQLSLLMTKPLGVKNVTNPSPSTGGDNPEQLQDARANAPVTVLTLDRIVSLSDYQDFARSFAGIAKSLATWTWDGQTRGVFVTIAGPEGAPVPTDSMTYKNLLAAMQQAGDPYVPLRVQTYNKARFLLAATVRVNPDYQTPLVLAAVETALRANFSFDSRSFGQPVNLSEVVAVMQAVAGVVAVDVTALYRAGADPVRNWRLDAALPHAGEGGNLSAAELLTLDPGPLNLGEMS